MRNKILLPLNDLTTSIVGTASFVAIVISMLGMVSMPGRGAMEADNVVSPVTEVARSDHGDDIARLGQMLSNWARSVTLLPCFNCNVCGIRRYHHELIGSPPAGTEGAWGFHAEACVPGVCADHGRCMGGPDDTLQQIANMIRTVSPAVLGAVVDRHREWLSINHDRQSLQLSGCGGSIVASYPVAMLPALQPLLQ